MGEGNKFLENFKKKWENSMKEQFEQAQKVAQNVIPSIKKDLDDESLEITLTDERYSHVIGENSFSLRYRHFLPHFDEEPDYDVILGLSQHEQAHLEKKFKNEPFMETSVDLAAAEKHGPYSLLTFHANIVKIPTPDAPWPYTLPSLVNLKGFFNNRKQERYVRKNVRNHYPRLLKDLKYALGLEIKGGAWQVPNKFGSCVIDKPTQKKIQDIYEEMIQGLRVGRDYVEEEVLGVDNPFSEIRKVPGKFIANYKKLEEALLLD